MCALATPCPNTPRPVASSGHRWLVTVVLGSAICGLVDTCRQCELRCLAAGVRWQHYEVPDQERVVIQEMPFIESPERMTCTAGPLADCDGCAPSAMGGTVQQHKTGARRGHVDFNDRVFKMRDRRRSGRLIASGDNTAHCDRRLCSHNRVGRIDRRNPRALGATARTPFLLAQQSPPVSNR